MIRKEMLSVEDVHVGYENCSVVMGASLKVFDGEMISLVGANGTGKTSLLKAVSGVVRAHAGAVKFEGTDITRKDSSSIVELGLIQVPEGRRLFPQMTVLENLELGAYSRTARNKKEENLEYVFKVLPDLKVKAKEYCGNLSGGQQQMVAIGRGLMGAPKLLVLDEPSIGLSPLLTKVMFDIIARIREAGTTILLVEQNVQVALGMADRGYVLEHGKIVMEGPAKDLLADDHLRKAYLGM